jgi:rhodanese-related sulfurtransferase
MAMNIKINQNSIAAGDLNTRLTEQPETVLIDLLSQEHFARRHIPGARSLCFPNVIFR